MSMKKRILLSISGFLIVIIAVVTWKFFGPSVHAPEKKYFYIHTGDDYDKVIESLQQQDIISARMWFKWASGIVGYKTVKPGRYEIKQGMSLLALVRMLNNGKQSPVDFVITKIRVKETLASRLAKAFECDSMQVISFFNNPDSLKKYNLDTTTIMVMAMPFTYTLKWNTTPRAIADHFYAAYKNFWTDKRKEQADSLGLTPVQVSVLASIIDEETNAKTDRPNIASVYLNRIKKGMPLQADPTVKFAMRNFALKRVLNVHLQTISPYNTYVNKGLPPGPICTPQLETIDAVLNSPKTDYIYFVANSTFDGTHIFTTNYADHMKYARIYQEELNKRNIK